MGDGRWSDGFRAGEHERNTKTEDSEHFEVPGLQEAEPSARSAFLRYLRSLIRQSCSGHAVSHLSGRIVEEPDLLLKRLEQSLRKWTGSEKAPQEPKGRVPDPYMGIGKQHGSTPEPQFIDVARSTELFTQLLTSKQRFHQISVTANHVGNRATLAMSPLHRFREQKVSRR